MARRGTHPYVAERNGVFHYRRRVPRGAEERFGGRREFVRTLKARSWREAQAELASVMAEFERLARPPEAASPAAAEIPNPDPMLDQAFVDRLARAMLKEIKDTNLAMLAVPDASAWEDVAATHKQTALHARQQLLRGEKPAGWVLAARTMLKRAGIDPDAHPQLLEAAIKVHGELRAELGMQLAYEAQGEPGRVANAPMFGAEAYGKDDLASRSFTLDAAAKRFLSDPLRQVAASTLQQYRPRLKVIVEALGPRRPIQEVTKADCKRFVEEVVLHLPSNHTKKYPGVSLVQAIKRGGEEGAPVIALKTQKLYVELLRTFFEWAEKDDLIQASPARMVPLPKGRKTERQAFTPEQLQLIFDAPLFTGCVDDDRAFLKPGPARPRRHRFWIPLIALYSGMRLNEIALLRVRDIVHEWGVDAFDLREDLAAGRTLKTKGSERKVPIHPVLKRLGLLDYANGLPKDGYLFPDLVAAFKDPGDAMSKWFNRFRTGLGITDKGLVFHSFRHTFATGCRACDIPREQVEAIGGWVYRGTSGGYGRQDLQALAAALDRLEYRGLDLGGV